MLTVFREVGSEFAGWRGKLKVENVLHGKRIFSAFNTIIPNRFLIAKPVSYLMEPI